MGKKEIRETTIKTANELAQSKGYENAQELLNTVKADMNSDSAVKKSRASDLAGDFTKELALLVLYQEIDSEYRLGAYKFLNKFESEKIEYGNSKQYIRDIITGGETFDIDKFIPDKVTNPQIEQKTISLYETGTDGSRTLSQYGFKYKKPLTISREQWLPFFLSGKLQEFIDGIVNLVNTSFEIFRITVLQNMFSDLKISIKNKVTGTADNILSCFTNDIYPLITKMNFLQSDFNLDSTAKSLNSAGKDDLLIFVNNKTYTALNSGVLSQIFNSKLADLSSYINDDNIIPVSKKLVATDSDTAISVSNDDLIAENEILVISKNAIKQLYWVNTQESQSWAHNLTMEIILHVWGAFGFLPWAQGFYYKNDNLTVLPQ